MAQRGTTPAAPHFSSNKMQKSTVFVRDGSLSTRKWTGHLPFLGAKVLIFHEICKFFSEIFSIFQFHFYGKYSFSHFLTVFTALGCYICRLQGIERSALVSPITRVSLVDGDGGTPPVTAY